jgi:MoxR-like ATPase
MISLEQSKGLSMIPFLPENNFTGREDELQRLKDDIASPDGPRVLALTGLGGIGKTQIAAQFARRARKDIPGYAVFWIQCTSIESIQKGFVDITRGSPQ